MSREKIIIDRLEGEYAVCERENRETFVVEKELLPPGAQEGAGYWLEDGVFYPEATADAEARRQRIKAKMKALQKK